MNTSANIIERIKKLLRLGADARGNAHEAERAMAMAFELAEKHRVDVESLSLDDETARAVHERWHMGRRFDRVRRGVFGLLQKFFHVTVCVSGAEMIVVGRAQDVTIARYVHDFLLRAARECLRAWEAAEKAERDAVMDGLAPGRKTLPALEARRHLGALCSGLRDGEKTNIHTPLGATPGVQLALEKAAIGGNGEVSDSAATGAPESKL
jgi:hypothetical protein